MVDFYLDKTKRAPMLLLNMGISVMLDTSARIPIFTRGEELFTKAFPKAVKRDNAYGIISGFGGSLPEAPVYMIPTLRLNNVWQIHAVPIVVLMSAGLPTMVLPYRCLGRSSFKIYSGVQPSMSTDIGETYASSTFAQDGELLYVSVLTATEHEQVEYGKTLLYKDANGDTNRMHKIVNELKPLLPAHFLKERSFSPLDAVLYMYPTMRTTLK